MRYNGDKKIRFNKLKKEYRCKNCGKLLAKGDIKNLSIVCSRCKVYNNFIKVAKTKTIK